MSVALPPKQSVNIGYNPIASTLPGCGEKLYGGVNLLYMVQDLLSTVQNMLAGFALISKNIENEHSSKWEIKTAANRPVVTLCYKEIHSKSSEDEPEIVVPEVNLRSSMDSTNSDKLSGSQNKPSTAVPVTLTQENVNIWENLSKCLASPKIRSFADSHSDFISPPPKQTNFSEANLNGQNTTKMPVKIPLQEKEFSPKSFLPGLNSSSPQTTSADTTCLSSCQNTGKELLCRTCNLIHTGDCRVSVAHNEEPHHLMNRGFHSAEPAKRKEPLISTETSHAESYSLRKVCKDYNRRGRQPSEMYPGRDANGTYLEEIFNNEFDKTIVTFGMKEPEEEIYPCGFCSKKFSVLSKKNRHERIHTGERPYFCTFCNKSFAQLTNKKIHEYTHTGEKPYPCNYCGRRFAQLSNKKSHERIHWREQNLTLKPVPTKIL